MSASRQAKRQKTAHGKEVTDMKLVTAANTEPGTDASRNTPDDENGLDFDDYIPSRGVCDETSFEESLVPVKSLDKSAVDCGSLLETCNIYTGAPNSKYEGTSSNFRRSIYVEAFDLTLRIVMEQEAHLFDEKEKTVFREWWRLNYDAQFLYVRLFLRKTSRWHRCQDLNYHSEISDLMGAVSLLKQTRKLLPSASLPSTLEESHKQAPRDPSDTFSFVFVESSTEFITTLRDAILLLSLDELRILAKESKVSGKTKADLQSALIDTSTKQTTLTSAELDSGRTKLLPQSSIKLENDSGSSVSPLARNTSSNLKNIFFNKVMGMAGPCIRVSPCTLKIFERVHLVFYRTSEWTEKSLKTIILAKMSKRNFPAYVVSRTANIFESRQQLLEFEEALELEHKVDQILDFGGPANEADFMEVVIIFVKISDRWRQLLQDEQQRMGQLREFDDDGYLRRFKAAHIYTRLAHKAAYSLGRLHEYAQEHSLLKELLAQRYFHISRRGAWYQRKALLEEHYMSTAETSPKQDDPDQQRKFWLQEAVETCQRALEDQDCHVIYQYDLQKRLLKLEKRLRIPRRLQHDFAHLRLAQPEQQVIDGIQIKRESDQQAGKARQGISTKTIWVDESGGDNDECSVEDMCLNHYRREGWKGFHSEGGIVRTLFAYLFYDILFLYVPNVFQTAYQTCPLDLYTDAFYPTRVSEINQRLARIANGEAEHIVREVHASQAERRTSVVGLDWDFDLQDIVEIVQCFKSDALATLCKVLAQEYRQRTAGLPDLLVWRLEPKPELLFAEVKSANDHLSDTQRLWIHVLAGAGIRVLLCNAVARDVRIRG